MIKTLMMYGRKGQRSINTPTYPFLDIEANVKMLTRQT